ncbi:hypothetical protein Q9233_000828 [Columba guinea]|nr:hypothetical protein Q9233_000828 [Columba guinea]
MGPIMHCGSRLLRFGSARWNSHCIHSSPPEEKVGLVLLVSVRYLKFLRQSLDSQHFHWQFLDRLDGSCATFQAIKRNRKHPFKIKIWRLQ